MKNIKKRIKNIVRKELKVFRVFNKKEIEKFSSLALDEYQKNIEDGKPEELALATDYVSVKTNISSIYKYKKYNNYQYSLFISTIAFIVLLILSICCLVTTNVLYMLRTFWPIFTLFTLIYVCFTLATYKKRNILDFIVLLILLASVVAITTQCVLFFYRPNNTGNYYHELYYGFPGTLKFCFYWITGFDPIQSELREVTYLFDPTLISSFVCFVSSLVLYLLNMKKLHANNNNSN